MTEDDYDYNKDSNSDLHVMEPLVEIVGGSIEYNKEVTEKECPLGTCANECSYFGKQPFDKSKIYKSRRKDKDNYVFILILNDSKGSTQVHNQETGKSSMNVIDISSVVTNKDALLDDVSVENVNFRPKDIKNVVGKVIGDLSKKRDTPLAHPLETIENGHQYFLVLNCSIPFDVAKFPESMQTQCKDSNKLSASKTNKAKLSARQQSNTEDKTSPKGIVHKFKGGLTKRYLLDNSNEGESVIDTNDHLNDQNDRECDDYEDYDDNSNDFIDGQESDDETTLLIVSSGDKSRNLQAKKTKIGAKKSKENTNKRMAKAKCGKKLYHCERCVKSFNTMKLLKSHKKRSCCINRKASDLKKRARGVHDKGIKSRGNAVGSQDQSDDDGSLLSCDTCKDSFKTKRELRLHIRTVCNGYLAKKVPNRGADRTPSSVAICDVCGKMCRNRSYLLEHMAGHENLRTFICNECGKGFNKSGFLRKHMKTVHGNLRYWYFCSHCGLKSESKEHIEKHEQIHTLPEGVPVPTPFQCSCGKAFISKHALRCHKHNTGRHGSEEPFKSKVACPICAKLLSSSVNLNMHLENKHNLANASKRERLFGCNQCDKKFARFGSFLNHKIQAHQEPVTEALEAVERSDVDTRVECQLCQKVCRNRTALSAHKYFRHGGGGAPVQCAACGKTFKNRGSLLSHNYRVHRPPEVARVSCHFCHKQFNDKNALWAHRKYVHSTNKAHNCGECGSKFKRKGDYLRHMRDKHGVAQRDPLANASEPALDSYSHVADPAEGDLGGFTFEVLHCEPL